MDFTRKKVRKSMHETDDHKDGERLAILLAVLTAVAFAVTYTIIAGLNREIQQQIEEKDKTAQACLRELKAVRVQLEAVQEAQKSVQFKTFDVRDFPPDEDEPTICTPEDLDDDPTDPYKPGGPDGETGARSAEVSTPAPN